MSEITYMKCWLVIVVLLKVRDVTCLSLRHRRETDQISFTLCTTSTSQSYCSNHGTCYQNQQDPNQMFCRCDSDYFGDKCDQKNNAELEPLVLGIAIFAAIILIILIVISIILCRRKIKYDQMKKEHEEKCVKQRPTTDAMYYNQNEPKASFGSSAPSMDGKPRHHSYASQDIPDATTESTMRDHVNSDLLQTTAVTLPIDVNDQKDTLSVTPNNETNDSKQLEDGDDASVISDSNLSTTESDRNLIPPPISNISPNVGSVLTGREGDLYDQYFAERLATNQMLTASGYYPHPHSYTSHSYSPGRSPNTSPYGSPHGSAIIGNVSPTSTTHSNPAFVYMQPQAHTLYPQTTRGRAPKKSTSPTRFGPPQPSTNQQAKHPRKRSPAQKQQHFRDAQGRHMSLGDLRMMNEDMIFAATTIQYQRKRARSMENILVDRPISPASSMTNSIQSAATNKTLGLPENHKRNKKPGMWAQTQLR